jgi:hypothetical protein
VNVRLFATAVGAGLTTALVVGGLMTALLTFEFSAIIGVPVGLASGALAFVAAAAVDRTETPRGRLLGAYASVGYVVLLYAALSYVNLAGIRGTFSMPQVLVLGVAVGVLVFAGLWVADRDEPP